ncbi:hypothetical protein AVEN_222589-1 [Araneus ventricosus]|uniref:Uncharacterized protein n=1 Tax=Araneus ventricosus TaxID=182803 RepID=A0A4Y2K235_ARAVE|nr:hypothetical protein AVEN_222589-1 [Araneus ventricosus]
MLWRTETKRKVETCAALDSIPKSVYSATVCASRRCHLSTGRASPHYGNKVREFLDTPFPQRWIGRSNVMAWPPRSPDITPLDFYLLGYVKQHVYSERINDINHLKRESRTLYTRRLYPCVGRTGLSFRCVWGNIWNPHRTALNRYANLESFPFIW